MGNPIQPTVGRVVWFTPGPDFHGAIVQGQPLAAHVAAVWGPDCVTLMVIDANGLPHGHGSVMYDDGAGPRTWRWMPYQLGQAQIGVTQSGPHKASTNEKAA